MSHYVRVNAEADIASHSFFLHVVERAGSTTKVLTETTFAPVDEGHKGPPPSLHIGTDAAVDLMTQLWNAGVRPRGGNDAYVNGAPIVVRDGAVVFERTRNGWIVICVNDLYPLVCVYQDPERPADDTDVLAAESLKEAIFESFESYVQHDHNGGLVLAVKPKGRDYE